MKIEANSINNPFEKPVKQKKTKNALERLELRIKNNPILPELAVKTNKNINVSDLAKSNIDKNTNPTKVLLGSSKLVKIYIQHGGTLKNLMKGFDKLKIAPFELRKKAISNFRTAIKEKIKFQNEDRSIIGRIRRFLSQLFGFSNIKRAKELYSKLADDLLRCYVKKISKNPELIKEFLSKISELPLDKKAEYRHLMNGILEKSFPNLLDELVPRGLSNERSKGKPSERTNYLNKLQELDKTDNEKKEKNTKVKFQEIAEIMEFDKNESPKSLVKKNEKIQINDKGKRVYKKSCEIKAYTIEQLKEDKSKINEETVALAMANKISNISKNEILLLEDLLNKYVDDIKLGKQAPTIVQVMLDLQNIIEKKMQEHFEELKMKIPNDRIESLNNLRGTLIKLSEDIDANESKRQLKAY